MCVVGGYIYAVAGRDYHNDLTAVERYDPATNSWAYVAPLKREVRKPPEDPSQVHTVEAGPGPGPEPSCLHELCPELEWGAPSGIGRGPFPSYTPFWVSSPWTPAAAITLQVSVDGSLPLACPLAPLR